MAIRGAGAEFTGERLGKPGRHFGEAGKGLRGPALDSATGARNSGSAAGNSSIDLPTRTKRQSPVPRNQVGSNDEFGRLISSKKRLVPNRRGWEEPGFDPRCQPNAGSGGTRETYTPTRRRHRGQEIDYTTGERLGYVRRVPGLAEGLRENGIMVQGKTDSRGTQCRCGDLGRY